MSCAPPLIPAPIQGKTRVLVTNQLQFVRDADLVVVLSGGVVSEMGSYTALMANGQGFAHMMAQAEVRC